MFSGAKILIFLAVTIGFLLISGKSLKSYRYHGFYRFFTWESVLILILLNTEFWFDDPFSISQIFSWAFFLISMTYVSSAAVTLFRHGKQDSSRTDSQLIGIEKTTVLVHSGIYKYIRHPMYGSFIFAALGVLLKNVSLFSLILTLTTIILAVITSLIEEKENIRYFGNQYIEYKKISWKFIPYII